ncbi:unnamed protein product [Allacma fusca]|uniref:Uncharacterized protein n=1 Tax=Allacma fusca TaxID=39272 RepID=A0A8J2J632_9HEXA|nr:unnamed protein product [Allacma fusca]
MKNFPEVNSMLSLSVISSPAMKFSSAFLFVALFAFICIAAGQDPNANASSDSTFKNVHKIIDVAHRIHTWLDGT